MLVEAFHHSRVLKTHSQTLMRELEAREGNMLRWGVVSLLQFAIVDQMINPRI